MTIDLKLLATELATDNCITKRIPSIDHYIINDKTIIVFFKDGTKELATCDENDTFETETGIMMCILKKLCGDNVLTQVEKVVKKQTKYERLKIEVQERSEREREAIRRRQEIRREKKRKAKILKQAEFELAVEAKKKELKK